MTLLERREQWEKGLQPLVVIDTKYQVIVVLQNDEEEAALDSKDVDIYHCHRYFEVLDDQWDCSVDGQHVSLEAVFSWLNNPCAKTTKPDHYVIPEKVRSTENV